MRTLALCLTVGLTACAAGPSAPEIDPSSLVPVRVPAPDPYDVTPGPEWGPPVRIHAPRVAGWSPARHRAEVAAISSLLSVALDPVNDTTVVTGPSAAAEVAASFLADRARFEPARLRLLVHEARWPAEAWAIEALNRCEGGVWAVVPAEAAAAISRSSGVGFGALQLADGEEIEHSDLRQSAVLVACELKGSAGGVPVRDPVVGTVTVGLETRTTARLAGDADLLVLDWSCLRAGGAPEHATVAVGDARGFTAVPVALPRVQRSAVTGRFVLRDDEALLLVQAPPDGAEGVLITIVAWAVDRWVP